MIKFLLHFLLFSCTAGVAKNPSPIDDVDVRDYPELIKRCNENSCCVSSAKHIQQNKGFVLKEDATCPENYQRDMLKCISSYKWCEPVKK